MELLSPPDELFMRIEDCLERLLERSRAICVFLADGSGQLIGERGRRVALDTAALAAVAASNMAATGELARQMGESAPFSYLFHEGHRRNIYISAVPENFLLAVIFDEMTQIGLVRIFARLAVNELRSVAAELEPWMERVSSLVDEDFGEALAKGLDDAFI
ncbi:MAG: roadblock/LC7 domain-containing protein [Anaerolineae bacterium]|nr:roadblock/LC7 domain-containing protein [Anaerolineae bacterium]